RQVQQQARALLGSLRAEIRNKESELQQLRDEESRLAALTGGGVRTGMRGRPRGSVSASAGPRATRSGRVNWREVLTQVPKQFKAADIRDVRGLKGKRPSELFAAITRWIEAGSVRRKARGQYERVS